MHGSKMCLMALGEAHQGILELAHEYLLIAAHLINDLVEGLAVEEGEGHESRTLQRRYVRGKLEHRRGLAVHLCSDRLAGGPAV
jgi:hypothetical protein